MRKSEGTDTTRPAKECCAAKIGVALGRAITAFDIVDAGKFGPEVTKLDRMLAGHREDTLSTLKEHLEQALSYAYAESATGALSQLVVASCDVDTLESWIISALERGDMKASGLVASSVYEIRERVERCLFSVARYLERSGADAIAVSREHYMRSDIDPIAAVTTSLETEAR